MQIRIFIILSLISLASGTVLAEKPSENHIKNAIRKADHIAVGVVVDARAQYETNAYGDRLIITHNKINVEEHIKGNRQPASQDVAIEGGTVDGITLKVSHSAVSPGRGKRVLFLLKESKDGRGTLSPIGEEGVVELDGENLTGTNLNLTSVRNEAKR